MGRAPSAPPDLDRSVLHILASVIRNDNTNVNLILSFKMPLSITSCTEG